MSQTKVIHKFQLGKYAKALIEIDLPRGAEIVKVGIQEGEITLWAIVTPGQKTEKRAFAVIGTGWDLPEERTKYIDAVFHDIYVWHVLEIIS